MDYCSVHKLFITTFLFFIVLQTCSTQAPVLLKRLRECLTKPGAILCLKEEALDVLNQTLVSDQPMQIFNFINVEKNPDYVLEEPNNELPLEENERSLKINSLLYKKVEEFFESRMVKFSLSNAIEEGRKKKSKGGMLMMMGGLAMAGMMGQMFLGKIAFLAGSALLVAKMALMLSMVSALKKGGGGGGGGGGGESSHIVYATDSGGHGGGGGGGWHRSLNTPESPQQVAYSNYSPPDNNNNVNNNYGY